MEWAIIIGLIVAGLFLLLLEVMVIPGVGVVGIVGFAMIVFSIYRTFADHGPSAGIIVSVATFFLSLLIIWGALRSKTWRKISLDKHIDSKVKSVDIDEIKVGDKGKSIGRISPMGKAFINEKYYEVKAATGFIDHEKEITITRIDGTLIYVKEITQTNQS